MQIYLDPDTVEFYKQYARKEGTSFAEAIRVVVEEKRKKIEKKVHKKKKALSKKKEHPIMGFIRDAERKFKHTKYYHPELSDDELLYGKD